DFACVALLDAQGKEKAKAHDGSLTFLNKPLDYANNALFNKVTVAGTPDTGAGYSLGDMSFFDILFPVQNGPLMFGLLRSDALRKVLFEEQVGQQGYIRVIDEGGRVVGDSRKNLAGQDMNQWDFFKKRLEDEEEWRGEFNDPVREPMVGASAWVTGAGWMIL